jgi:hypothetical protein
VSAAARRGCEFESRCAVGIDMLYSWSLVLDVCGEMSRRNLRFRRLIDGGCGVDLLRGFTSLCLQLQFRRSLPLDIFAIDRWRRRKSAIHVWIRM